MRVTVLSLSDVADIDPVAALMSRTFGERGDEPALLKAWQSEPLRCVRVAYEQNNVVGLAVLTITQTLDSAKYEKPFDIELNSLVRDEPVAEFNQILVTPNRRQRGVAARLTLSVLEWLKSQQVGAVLGISWQHGDADHSGHLFERGGFSKLGKCERFYRRFHEETKQRCTRCQGLCECTAVLYGIRFEQLNTPT